MTAQRDARVMVDDAITRLNDLRYSPADRRAAAVAYLDTIVASDPETQALVAAIKAHLETFKGIAVDVKVPPDAKTGGFTAP